MYDLDYILVERDKLYKLLGFEGYFTVEELPRQVKIFEYINIYKYKYILLI